MKMNVDTLLSEKEIDARVRELGAQISRDYAGKSVKLICILKGACFFACELAKRITVPVFLDFMSCSSYGDGTESSGDIIVKKDLDDSIEDQHVIVVEDIIDSGRTLYFLKKELSARGAESVAICTLLDKPDRRVMDVHVDYVGFTIPDQFVVGYGLDYAQRYRNLPYVGIVSFEEETDGTGGADH